MVYVLYDKELYNGNSDVIYKFDDPTSAILFFREKYNIRLYIGGGIGGIRIDSRIDNLIPINQYTVSTSIIIVNLLKFIGDEPRNFDFYPDIVKSLLREQLIDEIL